MIVKNPQDKAEYRFYFNYLRKITRADGKTIVLSGKDAFKFDPHTESVCLLGDSFETICEIKQGDNVINKAVVKKHPKDKIDKQAARKFALARAVKIFPRGEFRSLVWKTYFEAHRDGLKIRDKV